MRGGVVFFLLLADDGVRKGVGEADGRNGVVLGAAAVAGIVVLDGEEETSARIERT